jgi:hypothetical protein
LSSPEGIEYQLVPPHDHRANAAERAVRTAKNHLAATWADADDDFLMHLWDKTLPQAEMTVNFLRGSRINPRLSAWEQIHGRYNFNKMPIAPVGIKVLAHEKPDNRKTWAPPAFEAWYIGPAPNHYRCFTVWSKETRQLWIVNSLQWYPQKLAMPIASKMDLLRAAFEDVHHVLVSPDIDIPLPLIPPMVREELVTMTDCLLHSTDPTIDKLTPKDHPFTPAPSLRVAPQEPAIARPVTPAPPLRVSFQEPPHQEGPRRSPRLNPNLANLVTDDNQPAPLYCSKTRYAYPAVHLDTGRPAKYKDLSTSSQGPRWKLGMSKEFGRLFQGYESPTGEHNTKGTDTCAFIKKQAVPKDNKKATYIRIVSEYREQKEDPYRIRMTVDGNLVEVTGDISTKGADLVTAKVLINDIIITPNC